MSEPVSTTLVLALTRRPPPSLSFLSASLDNPIYYPTYNLSARPLSPDEELRRSLRRRETPKFFRSDRKMTPAQPEAQVPYRTLAWRAVARGASDAERDQSRALCVHGKRGPKTGDDPRDPHLPGTQLVCCWVLRHTRRERCTRGTVGRGPAQRGSRAAEEGLLRNRKMRSYRIHTDSETKTVAIETGCKDTMVMHAGPSAGELQGLGTAGLGPRRMAGENRREKKP